MMNIFEVKNEDCLKLLDAIIHSEAKTADKPFNWVLKCWQIITESLHDEVYRKISQTPRGHIETLLSNIAHALVINNAEEVQPLKAELWSATMQKDCGCDLQAWINFIQERANKLEFLGKKVDDDELVTIFQRGLHPVFSQLQVYFSIPGNLARVHTHTHAYAHTHGGVLVC